jgi:serine-type D-Ala-D-Ala carboxypeptidase (penicillin-binding protein 5/6)
MSLVRFFSFTMVLLALGFVLAQPARAYETAATQAILIDADTGAVLFEKNADEVTFPSSMTKLMTIYLVFAHLADGSLSLDDELPVSEKAWRMQGSKMFVEVGNSVRVEDLIRGVVVQSGNDATVVLAEGLAGSEEAFAVEMTEMAHEMGMSNTEFRNASGWPDPEHVTTAHDLAILAQRTIQDFPQYYHYYAEEVFVWNDIEQHNRNPLLYNTPGTDGLKTGHTEAAGYGLVASAERDGRRLILVINGTTSTQERASEGQRLMEYGFREFETYDLFAQGEVVSDADVWLGQADTVPLVLEGPLALTMSRSARQDMEVKVIYEGPVPAPVAAGQPIAQLVITAPDMPTVERPLLAGQAVPELSMLSRLWAAIGYLVFGPPAAP